MLLQSDCVCLVVDLSIRRFAIVPGVGTLEPDKWRDDTGESWIEAIPSEYTPGLASWVFPHGLNASENSLWQSLMDSGDRLLSNLLYLQEHEKVEHYGEIGH